MNDPTEQVTCPVCGKEITIILEWQEAEWDTGVREGWVGGVAIEDGACLEHMSYEQTDAVIDAAVAQHGVMPPYHDWLDAEARMPFKE